MSSVDQNQSHRPFYQIVLSKVHWSVLEIHSFFLNEIISSSYFKQRLPKLKQRVSFYLLQTRNKIGLNIFPYIRSLGLTKTVTLHVRSLSKGNNPIALKFKRGNKVLLRRNHFSTERHGIDRAGFDFEKETILSPRCRALQLQQDQVQIYPCHSCSSQPSLWACIYCSCPCGYQ